MFLKLLVKQNSAIGASAPVVDPVVELIGWIAIRRDLLRSLLLDIVQMDQHPGRKKGHIKIPSEEYLLLLCIKRGVKINLISI